MLGCGILPDFAGQEPMARETVLVITYGFVAAAANFIGGMLVSRRYIGQAALRHLIAIGAGFMLATVFLKAMPESVELWAGKVLPAMVLSLGGYLLIQLFEHTVAPHFHFGEETHQEAMLGEHAAIAGIGALMIHTFFDGISIAVGFLVNFQLGLLIFIAILLHKLPEGFTVASMMLAAGRAPRSAMFACLMVGLTTLAGAALVVTFREVAVHSRSLALYLLPLSAGVTLYVAASDLIPEVNTRKGGAVTSLLVFAGVALFYLAKMILETFNF
jgi:zinc transporter ZupT